MRIGVDTGGTFTDLVCLDDERGLRVGKLRSTPADPSVAVLAGIRALVGDDLLALTLDVTHGPTVATNAVLERKGARVALLTTAGFEDVLRLGRQTRPELYNFQVRRPEPLVGSAHTFGIAERVAADGTVLQALDLGEVEGLIPQLRNAGIESVAICFLHSYRSPAHEEQAAKTLRDEGFRVSASHEVLPEYREYERWATTAVNAYVAPLMATYLGKLQAELVAGAMESQGALRIMQSNGGSISAARASTEAVQTILSGPAAGVVGAQSVGARSGYTRLITFDMGGTSTDVSLIDGAIGTTNESLVGDLPVRLPVLDIHTVGAGGGSVAWLDSGGGLRVGPRSAGADPGPVCFGKGEELTVTDANLLLGRLDPGYFLGGRMTLDIDRTQRVAKAFGQRTGLSVIALAEGIVRIANASMERAVRVVSVQRGHDPRDFALLAFGGAGGLHACGLAESLEITTVLIPEHAGVLSALGMLLADVVKDFSAPVLQATAALLPANLRAALGGLEQRARAALAEEGFGTGEVVIEPALAMRYIGQAFEIDVPFPAAALGEGSTTEAFAASFHALHAKLYGYSNSARATECVQLRLRATGRTQKPPAVPAQAIWTSAPCVPERFADVVFAGKPWPTPLFRTSQLSPGMTGSGPALLIAGESTHVVPPDWTWRLDQHGMLVLTSTDVAGGHS